MKQSKFSESQIVGILGSVGQDKTVEQVCREHGISPATYYKWKSKYGGMGAEELKRMRDLEAENHRLKKLLAEKSLDYDILKEGYDMLKKN
jgi:putative transposase